LQINRTFIVLGGAAGTQTEIDLAHSLGKKLIAFPASGGTARRFYQQATRDRRLCSWMSSERFAALNVCEDPGEDFVLLVEQLINDHHGASRA
jgi:hypothetical protein